MTSLHNELELIYADLVRMREEFGDPRLHNLLFVKHDPDPLIANQYVYIEPIKASNPPSKLIGLETAYGRSHYISQQDLYFQVPRASITKAQLAWELTIDVTEPVPGEYYGGTAASVSYVDASKALYYGVVVAINKDTRPGERL